MRIERDAPRLVEMPLRLRFRTSSGETATGGLSGWSDCVVQGYRRVRPKIEPGADVDRVGAVREALPAVPLTVDANAAHTVKTSEPLLALGACGVISVKIGRVGGHGEALRIREAAPRTGVPFWCGGRLESGVGRARDIAVAALPGFSKPGDTASSSRDFEEDVLEPRPEAADGLMPAPAGPGIGVTVRRDVLAGFALETRELRA